MDDYQNVFVNSPFLKLKNFHKCARNHAKSKTHLQALSDANNYLKIMEAPENGIVSKLNEKLKKTIVETSRKAIPNCFNDFNVCN